MAFKMRHRRWLCLQAGTHREGFVVPKVQDEQVDVWTGNRFMVLTEEIQPVEHLEKS